MNSSGRKLLTYVVCVDEILRFMKNKIERRETPFYLHLCLLLDTSLFQKHAINNVCRTAEKRGAF